MAQALFDAIENHTNSTSTVTLNGAKTYSSSLNGVLDLFALGGACRGSSESALLDLFAKAYAEDELLALKTLFYLRDIRGGQGERKTFRRIIKYLADYYPNVLRKNLECIPEYGRWDDLLELHNTKVWSDALMYIDHQLKQDLANLGQEPPSLLAKWLPSINTSSRKAKMLAKEICKKLKYNYKEYRKSLSALRKEIKIVERDMCSKNWGGITYEQVPSQAMTRLHGAFRKNDTKRFERYIDDVKSGKKEIKSDTLYPYQIVDKVLNRRWGARENPADIEVLDAQWNALPDYIGPDNVHNGIAVVDTSGSMEGAYNSDSGITPISVAISLGIYFAERNTCEQFKNRFLTFSECPQLATIKGNDILSKVRSIHGSDWGMNTDLQAVFDLILNQAIDHKLTNNDIPDVVYIISDMEFDDATNCHRGWGSSESGPTNFEAIKAKFAEANYIMPKIVFWNVDAKQKQLPVTMDENGTALVSGASPSILKSLLSGDIEDPIQVMLETITAERYDMVTV